MLKTITSRKWTRGVSLLHSLTLLVTTLNDVSTIVAARSHRASGRSTIHLPAVERARKHSCMEPQPRAYQLEDLMDSQGLLKNGEKPNQPAYLVVRRCDGHSGCCPSLYMTCMPDKDSICYEELEIELSNYDRTTFRKNISVEQHYSCSCEAANQTERESMENQRPIIALSHPTHEKKCKTPN